MPRHPVPTDARLEVRDVTKNFGGVRAIDGVSFAVEDKTIFGLVGPNGAGKSTMISLMSGFARPDSGSIRFGGVDVSSTPPATLARLGLARTFQAATPLSGMTVLENVLVGLGSRYRSRLPAVLIRTPGMRREERMLRDEALGLLERVGLREIAAVPARDLPFGQLRFLEIARSLALRPRLLLLDEPAAGLNQSEVERLAELIRGVREQGTSVVLVDHDVSFLFGLCSEVTVLNFGCVVTSGSSAEVLASAELREAYLGDAAQLSEESS